MISKTCVYLALLLSVATNVGATNDWTKPCFQGSCSYDVVASNTSVAASLQIWGTSNAISDVTQAGGWIILDCNGTSSNQDIRLVCKSDDAASVGCDHLSQNGAEDTIVRLPESCGRGPFARVARAWTSENQTIPKWASSQIHTSGKRSLPPVHALTLDNKFSASTGSKHGPVSFSLVGTSAPTNGVLDVPEETRTRRGVQRRGLFSSIGKVFGGIKNAVSNDVSAAEHAVSSAVKGVKSTVLSVNDVNINKNKQLAPIDVDKSFNIATADIDCDNIGKVQFKVDADIKAHAAVSLGVVAAGTIIPPKVTTFSLTSGLNANVNGDITFAASASGSPVDTGEIQLFSVGIPGLDIPDVLQIGPTFAIKGRANMDVSLEADMAVAIAYSVQNAAFAFPPSSNAPAQGTPTPVDSPLSLSISPNVSAKGSLSAHIIPELNFGISALGGVASATVFLNLDSSATLDLTLSASGEVFSTEIGGSQTSTTTAQAAETAAATTTSVDTAATTDSAATDSDDPNASATDSNPSATDSASDPAATDAGDADSSDATEGDASDAANSSAPDNTSDSDADASTSDDGVQDDGASDDGASDAQISGGAQSDDGTDGDDSSDDVSPDAGSDSDNADDDAGQDVSADSNLSRRAVSVNGCVDMKLGIDAQVGAQGSFFGLFDVNKDFSLFSKDFDLFQKCFGNGGASSRRSTSSRRSIRSTRATRSQVAGIVGRRGTVNLSCPIKAAPKAQSVVDQTIPASSIHASEK